MSNWPQNVDLLKYKLRCNTSDPDWRPAESNDWSRDLPPWAIACNVYCITFCKHLRGALSTRTTASISLYFISTLLVYSYVNFLSQITVLTFSSMTSSSRDAVIQWGLCVTCSTYHWTTLNIVHRKYHSVNKKYLWLKLDNIDFGDGCWGRNVLVTSLRCWWPI